MNNGLHRYALSVPETAIDANGHVNNVEYIRWMQEAAISHADTVGCSTATREAGASWVVRSHHVEYLHPLFTGDCLVILTWVSNFQKIRSLRKYLFFRDTTVLARAETLWVFIEARTGRPQSIPVAVSSTFQLIPPENEPAGWVA